MKSTLKTLPRIFMILCLLGFAQLGAACGGDDKSLCEQSGEAMCTEACACGGANGCVFGDATGTFSFENKADCLAFLVTLGCSGDDGSLDAQFEACLNDLDSGMCVDDGSGGQAYSSPASCNN